MTGSVAVSPRILHLTRTLDPRAGGIAAVVRSLASAQAAAGHEVDVVTFDGAPESAAPDGVSRETLALQRVSRWPARPSQVDRLLSRCGVVHMHGMWHPAMVAIGRHCRRRGIPYVLSPHGTLDPWSMAQGQLKKMLAWRAGFRGLANAAGALHFLNDDEAALTDRLDLSAPQVVVPNGVDRAAFASLPAGDAFANGFAALAGHRYALFLGRLHYKKGLDLLVKAYAGLAPRFPQVDLVVAGPDDGAMADARRAVDAFDVTGRVHFCGPLYGQAKHQALAGAACFCLPSRQEGFSVAILEAMASACPVVITDACHFPEVRKAGAGWVIPVDADALGAALGEALADPVEAGRRGQAGRALVLERYTWDRVCERFRDIYSQLAAGTNPATHRGESVAS